MKLKKFLIVGSGGAVRVTTNMPYLNAYEVAISLELNIPDELFEKPRLEAVIDVPKDAIGQSKITTEVTDNIKEAIKDATDLDININIIEPEGGE